MSESLDLDTLVGAYYDGRFLDAHGHVAALIAELRACRAERDRALSNHEDCDRLSRQAIAEQRGRAERAEAAITRVEAMANDAHKWGRSIAALEVRAALRGDQ